MRSSYLSRLYERRAEIEAKLEMHDARYCFGDEEVEDGTSADLLHKLDEISEEIAVLERRAG